jgi:PAS domain S-box-containing protein
MTKKSDGNRNLPPGHDELAYSEELHRTTLESISDAVFITDDEGRFTYICGNVYFIFGRTADEVHKLGNINKLLGRLEFSRTDLREAGELTNLECEIIDAAGTPHSLLVNVKTVSIMNGTTLYTCRDITERKHAENQIIEHREMLRALTSELVLAEERERRRLATELHDHIGHALVMAKMQLLELADGELPKTCLSRVQPTVGLIEQLIQQARSLTFELSPPVLHELGLSAALEWLTSQLAENQGLDARFNGDGFDSELHPELRILLFQAVRELVRNVVRHAQATELGVQLENDSNTVCIKVSDNGRGFEITADMWEAGQQSGFGLFSIRERMRYLGGEFQLDSRPGKGTTVTLKTPLDYVSSEELARYAHLQHPRLRTPDQPVSILLADDHQLIRTGLVNLVNKHPGLRIVGEADNGNEAVELALKLKPDVVVMDIDMPVKDGISATEELLARLPGTRVLALSMHADRHYVRRMFSAGAMGYLLKDAAAEDLARAIFDIYHGNLFLGPRIADVVLEEFIQPGDSFKPVSADVLTSRELQVLRKLAHGDTSKEIAIDLSLSFRTVESHRYNIMKKLGIHNLAELVKFAIREGIAELNDE